MGAQITGVEGTLTVGPLDDVTLFGVPEAGFLTTTSPGAPLFVDSMAFWTEALYTAPPPDSPLTVPFQSGVTGLWFNAGECRPTNGWAQVYDSVVGNAGAFMNRSPGDFNVDGSEIRNITIANGADAGLLVAGAPQVIVENVQINGYGQIGLWFENNCYYSAVRDCLFATQKFAGMIVSSQSGDILAENVHISAQNIGLIVNGVQDRAKFVAVDVDANGAAAVVFALPATGGVGALTVSIDSCYLTTGSTAVAVAIISGQGGFGLRDIEVDQGTATPCVIIANPGASMNFVEISCSTFGFATTATGAPCVISHVGNAPLKPTLTTGGKTASTVPWTTSGDSGNINLLSVVG
jgi:hypothetical protein